MSNKLEILDKIIDIEDDLESKAMSEIPSQVTEEIKRLFGEEGEKVANVYYKKMVKGEDSPDCPECAEKAKKLIEFMKLSQTITDSLTHDDVNKCYDILKTDRAFIDEILKMTRCRLGGLYHIDTNLAKMVLIKGLALI